MPFVQAAPQMARLTADTEIAPDNHSPSFLTDHIVQSFSIRRMHQKTVTMSHLVAVDEV
jgi:hypothetical protein